MAPRTAFIRFDVHDGKLTVEGQSQLLPDADFIFREVVFEQDGVIVHGPPVDGAKGWSAVIPAPTFVSNRPAEALGIETYLIEHDGIPVFTTFSWTDSVVLGPHP
jgi:hypothetical protein